MKSTFTLISFFIVAFVAFHGSVSAQGPKTNIVIDVSRTERGAVIKTLTDRGMKAMMPTLDCDFSEKSSDSVCKHLSETIGANTRVMGVFSENNLIVILTKEHILTKAEIAMTVDIVTAAFNNNGVIDRNRPAYYPEDGYSIARFNRLPVKVRDWMLWVNEGERIHQPYDRLRRPVTLGGKIPTTEKDVQKICAANPSNCIATRNQVIRDTPRK